ncbi:uncharacterized protein JCM10292_003640 [Rhodotorula paludigena]|uniref:uncharacterized protein n=1 Tax=Rhodotorula paludigena TaxID=86838 RepID=UPI00316D9C27
MSSQSDASIIAAQAASLSAKTASDFRGQAKSDLASESGVTDGGLAEFPGATVEVGRGGMSGGGDNMRIPAEHGGSSQLGNGSHASEFDESAPAGESRASWAAKTQPGGVNTRGGSQEALRSVDAPADGQPQLEEQ